MVHVVPSNEKLRARAVRLVRLLTGADSTRATQALQRTEGKVVEAVRVLQGAKAGR